MAEGGTNGPSGALHVICFFFYLRNAWAFRVGSLWEGKMGDNEA